MVSLFLTSILMASLSPVASSTEASLYGETIDTCTLVEGRSEGFTTDVVHVADSFTPTYYEERQKVRSEIECTIICRRDSSCVTAFYDTSRKTCHMASESVHSMTPQSNTVARSGGGSSGFSMLAMRKPQSEMPHEDVVDTSSECSSLSCADGSHTCRKDCTNNVGICTARLTECDEIPVANVQHHYYTSYSDGTDNGVIKEHVYSKKYSYTALRVRFRAGSLRAAHNCGGCCGRWYFSFNGVECTIPGKIELTWYSGHSRDYYRPGELDGLCEGLPAGDITIRLHTGACDGYGISDTQTGWGNYVGASLTFEENDLRHSFENNLQTYDGNANGAACTFPFAYNGQSYSQCTEVNHNQLWCATTSNYDQDGKWGNCPGTCPHHSRFNIKQHTWTGVNGDDSGHLYQYWYYKRDSSTALRIMFHANIYIYQYGNLRYNVKIDQNDCTVPGAINGVYTHMDSNRQDPTHDGSAAVIGVCNNIGAGRHSIDIHLYRDHSHQDGYTGWKQRSRILVEEIRYNSDVQAVISPDGTIQRLPEFNIQQFYWNSLNDDTDNGHISSISVNYNKISSESMLEVHYHGDMRQLLAYYHDPGCAHWYITINGNQQCTDPGPLGGIVYQRVVHNHENYHDNSHHTATIGGLCSVPAGSYNLRLYVQNCPGHSYNEAYTCWSSSCRLIVKEVFLSTD